MEFLTVIMVAVLMLIVIFGSGYIISFAVIDDLSTNERFVISGVFGMAQVIFSYFLIKTVFSLGLAVMMTFWALCAIVFIRSRR